MFRELRLQHGLTQSEIADATHRTPNYILKAEDLTFPSPPVALLQFYRELDPALDVDLLTGWYFDAQRAQREKWLDHYAPTQISQPTFRSSWVEVRELDWGTYPTQYRLSKGLCIQASAVYNMDRFPDRPWPAAVGVAMEQLIGYTKSGRFSLNENFSFELIENLERIVEDFS